MPARVKMGWRMITEESAKKQLKMLHKEGSALMEEFEAEEARLLKLYGRPKPVAKDGGRIVILRFSDYERQKSQEEEQPEEASEPKRTDKIHFKERYQSWYSRTLPLMRRLAADRYAEFQSFYVVDPRYPWGDRTAFVIQDYFRGREHQDAAGETVRCLENQLAMLKSISDRLAWTSLDTDDQIERGLQLGFLDEAQDLMKVQERAAAVLAGAVFQSYLKRLSTRHKPRFRKLTPPLREYTDALQRAEVFDAQVHAQAVWLAGIAERSKRIIGDRPQYNGLAHKKGAATLLWIRLNL